MPVGEAFDIIFVNQLSPVMMGYAAMKYKNKYKVPAILYCLDLWPESLAAGGIKKNSFIYKIFHIISKKIYRNMDRILVTSRMFSEHLEAEFGIPKNMTEYLPQYAEDLFKVNSQTTNKSVCDLVFAGNIGRVQSIDTILEAAGLLRDKPINWHIIGSGTDLERLKNVAENTALDKVFFYGRRPVEEMPEFYAMADAMLVTMSADPVLSLTLPGKVQSYMAAGKPIIAAANGETAEIVANACCGFCGPAEDGVALAENVIRFLKSNDKAKFGYNARKFYDNNFAQNNFIKRFEDELTAVGTGQ